MRRMLIAAAVASLFLLAGVATVVQAKDPSDRPDRSSSDERKEKAKEMHEKQMEKRKEAWKARFFEGNATLSLSGSGMGRENLTYTVTVEGMGKAMGKLAKDNSTAGYRGVVAAHVVVKDANGTVVKEGDVRLKLLVHETDNGTKWKVSSFGHRENGMPKLVARGLAEDAGDGSLDLTGKGHMVIKKADGEHRATPIKLTEVSGKLTLPAAPAPAPAPAADDE